MSLVTSPCSTGELAFALKGRTDVRLGDHDSSGSSPSSQTLLSPNGVLFDLDGHSIGVG